MRRFFGAAHDDEGGQAIVLIGIVLMALLFAVGLAIDSGQLYNGRRTAQEAADAGAFAGAVVIYQLGSPAQARAAAAADAALNGYTTDTPSAGTTVIVQSPPTSGSYIGNVNCVLVTISTPVLTTLVPQSQAFTTVSATAVGCSLPTQAGYAVIGLDQACKTGAVEISSNGALIVHQGSIQVNSCASQAAQNAGTVTLDSGYETDVVGGVSGTWPSVFLNKPVIGDPFAGLPKPSTNGLPSYSPACSPSVNQPGIYTTDFQSCSFIFAPGTYIFAGSGLNLSGSNAGACTGVNCLPTPTAAGGVFFFFTSSSYPATGGTCSTQPVKIEGGVNTVLSPPTSGTYQGMLIWQDSQCAQDLNFGGTGSISTTGSIYAPGAQVNGNGNGSAVNVSQIIAKQVNAQNAVITVTNDAAVTFHGFIPALLE